MTKEKNARSFRLTFLACVFGIAGQAVVSNITAVLFVPFMHIYGFGIWQLGVLVGVNFFSQLAADVILTVLIDKIAYRKMAIFAVSLTITGLLSFALIPLIPAVAASGKAVYAVMIGATVIFAFSSGMDEVLLTPIVDSIPDANSGALALMHSFYAWGQVIFVVLTSLFIVFAGEKLWYVIVLLWISIPVAGLVLFIICPMAEKKEVVQTMGKTLFSPAMLLAMLAIFTAGGSEVVMNQYVSTMAQITLGFSKTVSDVVGMALFAAMLGLGRTIYGVAGDRLDMSKFLIATSLIAFVCYLGVGVIHVPAVQLALCVICGFGTSMLWPGALVVASNRFPQAGAWVFAVLAICGDLSGTIFPTVAGFVADKAGLDFMFAIFSALPLVCCITNVALAAGNKKSAGLPAQI